MGRTKRIVASLLALSAPLLWSGAGAAQTPGSATPNLARLLEGVAVRVQEYYDRVGTILCLETVTQQDLKFNLTPMGKPRVTVYELAVARDPAGEGEREFRIERTLQLVNGKRPRRNQEPECTDPKTGTPEPLAFLLAGNQARYRFSLAPGARGGPEGTVAIDFSQTPPEWVDIRWKGTCFEASGGGEDGRIWVDPETFDVLQVEARLAKPFLVPVPGRLSGVAMPIRVERSEAVLRFAYVKFEQPDETVLLPESIETLTVFRGVASLRITHKFSSHRRFLSESIIRPASY